MLTRRINIFKKEGGYEKTYLGSGVVFCFNYPNVRSNGFSRYWPKPSVTVSFKGLEDEKYYVTLLANTDSTGPWSMSGTFLDWYGDKIAWEKFNTYSDSDRFFFLNFYSDCSGTDVFKWTYYPPHMFKILIYFPEYDHFIVSADIYERYAFDSYYTVDATGINIQSATVTANEIPISRTYDFTWEIISLLCRIVATIAIELGTAWLFGFRSKTQIIIIGITNIVTQTILNVLLNIVNYSQGQLAFILNYVWMEIVIFVIEGIIFAKLLYRYEKNPTRNAHPWLFAFAANVASFAVGMLIAKWIPGIF